MRRETALVAREYQRYEAYAFHPSLGQEPISGTISFTSRSLTFQGGETLIEIPLSQLQAEFDSAGEGRIIFRNSNDADWTIATLNTEPLEARSVPQIDALAQQLESQLTRRELSRRARLVVVFLAGCTLVFWLGMLVVGAMVRSIVAKIPPEVENQQGEKAFEELEHYVKFIEDSNVVSQLAATAEPLLRTMPPSQEWHFYIIDSRVPNAFALPGGHIMVTSSLLRLAERPEQVLGVIAHELAHVTQKHAFRQRVASAGPILVLQVFLGGRNGAATAVAGGSALLIVQSFSQEYEKEADEVGWNYLVAANIDPRGMTEMFRKFKSKEHSSMVPKAFQSHPDTERRIARLEKKWKKLPRKSDFIELHAHPRPETTVTNPFDRFL
jgi:Zn-dependent protease with chaperone function